MGKFSLVERARRPQVATIFRTSLGNPGMKRGFAVARCSAPTNSNVRGTTIGRQSGRKVRDVSYIDTFGDAPVTNRSSDWHSRRCPRRWEVKSLGAIPGTWPNPSRARSPAPQPFPFPSHGSSGHGVSRRLKTSPWFLPLKLLPDLISDSSSENLADQRS